MACSIAWAKSKNDINSRGKMFDVSDIQDRTGMLPNDRSADQVETAPIASRRSRLMYSICS